MKLAALGAALVMAISPGCDRMLTPARPRVYAAWEEGLTLGFEDPSQADAGLRTRSRQTVRVKQSVPSGGGTLVTKTFASLNGQWETRVLQQDGGVRLLADGTTGILLLPEGFPDRVSRWQARGSFNWVVGRATAELPGIRFADHADAVGVWVESISASDPADRTRTLYLPDLGEVESRAWDQSHWRWVTTNLLVTRGFTDVPAPPQATTTHGSSQ
jgi:hypothetical protein